MVSYLLICLDAHFLYMCCMFLGGGGADALKQNEKVMNTYGEQVLLLFGLRTLFVVTRTQINLLRNHSFGGRKKFCTRNITKTNPKYMI